MATMLTHEYKKLKDCFPVIHTTIPNVYVDIELEDRSSALMDATLWQMTGRFKFTGVDNIARVSYRDKAKPFELPVLINNFSISATQSFLCDDDALFHASKQSYEQMKHLVKDIENQFSGMAAPIIKSLKNLLGNA